MISVKIGELRNHLSAYLKKVRQGSEVVIADRETPIGRLIPYRRDKGKEWVLVDPAAGYEGLADISFSPCKPACGAVEELLAERRAR